MHSNIGSNNVRVGFFDPDGCFFGHSTVESWIEMLDLQKRLANLLRFFQMA